MSNDNDQTLVQDELATLKQRADLMGIQYHPSIGLAKLKEKVQAAMNDQPPSDDDGEEDGDDNPNKGQAPVEVPVETKAQKLARIKMEATRLVRIRLTCMNPAKKDWDGEIFTVGNSGVGTLKKYVPFNADDGWHVPYMMYEHLRERMCQVFITLKSKNGVAVRQGKLIKEFAIELLPDLTAEELAELARKQAMSQSVG